MKDLIKSFLYFFESILNMVFITAVSLVMIIADQLRVSYRCFRECKSFRDRSFLKEDLDHLRKKLKDMDE